MNLKLRALKKPESANITKIFLIAIIVVGVILPLFFILAELGEVNFGAIVASSGFLEALGNSISVSLTTTLLSMAFAFMLAFFISNSKCRFKSVFSVVITIPMLIPSISHGTGIITIFGESGILTELFGTQSNIYGFVGVMLGSFLYSFPVAFLMFSDILKYQDRQIYQVADIMGVPKYRQFFNLTLPYLAKPCISIFFAIFTLIFTDYGVVMMVGGRFTTLPLLMYNEVIGRMNYGVGAVISLVLMIPAVIACVADILKKNNAGGQFSDKKSNYINSSKRFDIAAYIICAVSLVVILFPVISFCIIGFVKQYPNDLSFTLAHFSNLIGLNMGQYLVNSLLISVLASLLGVGLTFIFAYYSARTKNNVLSKLLHIFALLSLAIPGVVLGISYLLLYGGTAFAKTLFILIAVNIVHFFSSPYLLAYNAFGKINSNYEIVVKTLGIGKFRYMVDILIPEMTDTLFEMFTYIFVNSMITISAVSFLANSNTNPLALLINQMEQSMMIESIAVVSLIILAINVAIKMAVYLFKLFRNITRLRKNRILLNAQAEELT